jgi:Na+/melibiose symporter-like transporter
VANFITVQASIWVQIIYYVLMGSLFWIAYSLFYIPYTALGAEIALDYDGRTKLRSITRVFTIMGTFLANVCPLLAIGILLKLAGFNEALRMQSAETIAMLKNIFVLFSSVLLLVATLTLLAYPLSKKRFELLQKTLTSRSKGEDYKEYKREIEGRLEKEPQLWT